MYNEYEEYMKSVLGYPTQYESNTYNNHQYIENNSFFPYRYNNTSDIDNNLESMYPEIYKILQPMVQKACSTINYRSFSIDTLEVLTDEIYKSVETDENLNIVNVNVRTQEADELLKRDIKISPRSNKMSISEKNNQKESAIQNTIHESEAESKENRNRISNPTLRDLIKILLLNQILNNNPNRPPRPPRPPMPPPRPPRPPYRSLENPAIYNNDYSSNQSYQPYNFFN